MTIHALVSLSPRTSTQWGLVTTAQAAALGVSLSWWRTCDRTPGARPAERLKSAFDPPGELQRRRVSERAP